MIVILDYGMGNLHSILKAFKRIGVDAMVSSRIEDIEKATKFILPGVGHFKKGMENLRKLGFVDILNKKVIQDKTPLLGICLGMQLLTKHSEEGDAKGLGWFDAETIKLNFPDPKFKIPHMGWDTLNIKKQNTIFSDVEEDALFYFVHSFHVKCNDPENILSTTTYGLEFVSAIQKENILGMQFHPEKSHKNGLQILKNFAGKI